MRYALRGSLLLVLLLGSCSVGFQYNYLVGLEERVGEARANVAVNLARRGSLIPNLVAAVAGAATFERGTQGEVARLRARQAAVEEALRQGKVAEADGEGARLSRELGLFVRGVREGYPELAATAGFRRLMAELEGTENRLVFARRDYNAAVRQKNAAIREFPGRLVAGAVGIRRSEYFQGAPGAGGVPPVRFPAEGSVVPDTGIQGET